MGDEHDAHRVIEVGQRIHELLLGVAVQRSGRLIENQEAGFAQERAGNADTLTFPAGQPAPARACARIEALRKPCRNEFGGGLLECCLSSASVASGAYRRRLSRIEASNSTTSCGT